MALSLGFRSSQGASSDHTEVRRRIQVVSARVVDQSQERSLGFDLDHLVDLAQSKVMTTAGLVTSRICQPWLHADALHESGRLPSGRHTNRERRRRTTSLTTPREGSIGVRCWRGGTRFSIGLTYLNPIQRNRRYGIAAPILSRGSAIAAHAIRRAIHWGRKKPTHIWLAVSRSAGKHRH